MNNLIELKEDLFIDLNEIYYLRIDGSEVSFWDKLGKHHRVRYVCDDTISELREILKKSCIKTDS